MNLTRVPPIRRIQELPVTHEATIPPDYLDSMGHMNVMWYTHLFSQGMQGLFEMVGLGHEYISTTNSGCFALEKHFKYLAEVRVGQHVKIHSRLVARNEKRFHVFSFMVNETRSRVAATSETVGTHVDLTLRRSSPLPDSVATQMDELMAQQEQLELRIPLSGLLSVG